MKKYFSKLVPIHRYQVLGHGHNFYGVTIQPTTETQLKLALVMVKQSSKRNYDNITKPKPVLIPLDHFYEIAGVAGEYQPNSHPSVFPATSSHNILAEFSSPKEQCEKFTQIWYSFHEGPTPKASPFQVLFLSLLITLPQPPVWASVGFLFLDWFLSSFICKGYSWVCEPPQSLQEHRQR